MARKRNLALALSLQMSLPLGARLQASRVFLADAAQTFRLELLLGERHAAIEHLGIAADAGALQVEAADAVEHHTGTLGLGPLGTRS